ncbi:methyltransferase domain-containing protein [Candidatus Shapirobacteria bacterium]|nr:methyltransferase domain-containing protein [Candidatus Shapirobacteria bacterium]
MSIIKVNLGCGPSGIDGWTNLDWGMLPLLNKLGFVNKLVDWGFLSSGYKTKWPVFKLFDIRKKLPFADNSVDFVYCSHVLEHFENEEAINILWEIKRILKTDGMARIVLPDVKKIALGYVDARKINEEFWGYDKQVLVGWRRWFIRGHRWMYDVDEIKSTLEKAGFKKNTIVSFKKGKTPDISLLDVAGYSNISLYVESTKG